MAKKEKVLKIWNGRGQGKYNKGHVYVAAYTQSQCAKLLGITCCGREDGVSPKEIKKYFADGCWGNNMADIIPTEPCVYVIECNDVKTRKRLI